MGKHPATVTHAQYLQMQYLQIESRPSRFESSRRARSLKVTRSQDPHALLSLVLL